MNYDFFDYTYDVALKDKMCLVDKSTGELVWSDSLTSHMFSGCRGYSVKNKVLYLDSFDGYDFLLKCVEGDADKFKKITGESLYFNSEGVTYDNKNIKRSFIERKGVLVLDESDASLDEYDGVDVELLNWEVDVLSGVCRLDYKNNRGLSMRKLIFIIKSLDEVSACSIMKLLNIKKSNAYNYLGAYKVFAEAFRVQMNRMQGRSNPWIDEKYWYWQYLEMVKMGNSKRAIAKTFGLSESTLRNRVKSKMEGEVYV